MNSNQSITINRLQRLSINRCLLGEPDIISIKVIKTSTSFFNKEKKIQDLQQNYINGLIFPTTAHFSSFVSSRYKSKDSVKLTIKAKLYMFDAYDEKDIQIQVSIPGSLEVKAFNLKGQPLDFSNEDYNKAYYSSFLRSLYPMNYPKIILYPLLNRLEIMRPILKSFVQFTFKHQLRKIDYYFSIFRNQTSKDNHNISLQIVVQYCLDNNFFNLLKVIMDEVKKINQTKYNQIEIRQKLRLKEYPSIICKTAEKLLLHGNVNKIKQIQIKALYHVKKYSEIVFIGKTLIQSGGTTAEISTIILQSMLQIGQDKKFLKTLNLICTLHNYNQKNILDVSHKNEPINPLQLQSILKKHKSISQYSQLCFQFDNSFFNRLQQYHSLKRLIQKNTKEGFTLNILQRIQQSLNNNPIFYNLILKYEKTKGWKTLLKNRGECFWMENDFQNYQMNKQKNSKEFNDNYSFFDAKYDNYQQQLMEQDFSQNYQKQHEQKDKDNDKNKDKDKQIKSDGLVDKEDNKSFDGNFSQHNQDEQFYHLPKCSTRIINTTRKISQKKQESKILCGMYLENLYTLLFNDIKLQASLEQWEQKLKQMDLSQYTFSKKEIAAMIFMKKGFLHKKLLRNKKCEESFKMARKCSNTYSINLVATYQLILLFIDNKNVKGVQFYLIEMIKLLKGLGVQYFDIVPQWAKPILQFVIENEGLGIIKNIHALFKNVFAIYLRGNYSEQDVEIYTQMKKNITTVN